MPECGGELFFVTATVTLLALCEQHLLPSLFSLPSLSSPSITLAIELTTATILGWYLCLIGDYLLHTIGHSRFSLFRPIYTTHMQHHKKCYPVGKLLQKAPYLPAGGENAFLPPLFVVWAIIIFFLPSRFSLLLLVESVSFLLVSDYLHTQYHVQGSWLEGLLGDWFFKRREYHFHHHHRNHENMSLGGLSSFADRLFGTHVVVSKN